MEKHLGEKKWPALVGEYQKRLHEENSEDRYLSIINKCIYLALGVNLEGMKEIRKVIYTTNAIESLNCVIRKPIRNRKIFSSEYSVIKIVYPAIEQASRKWTMPIQNWKPAMNRFAIEYEGRFDLCNWSFTQNSLQARLKSL